MDRLEDPFIVAPGNGMLPTPARTPHSLNSQVPAAGMSSVARRLFTNPIDDAMPSAKRGKKYTGFSMNSFGEEEDETSISIFTDSHDRVPERDVNADNPFWGPSDDAIEPMERMSEREKAQKERRRDGIEYML